MSQHQSHGSSLPHHRLLAYQKSLELLAAVRGSQIRDAKLRDEALRAAKGTCLNLAESATATATASATATAAAPAAASGSASAAVAAPTAARAHRPCRPAHQ
jgi:hypothetical protein